ncbi:hypothetical protein P9112_002591 [Eukaryota sp. TZLM1-RC]
MFLSSLGRDDSIENKRRLQEQRRLELQKQMEEVQRRKEEERRKEREYELKLERESMSFQPFGRSGHGAPIKDNFGNNLTRLDQVSRSPPQTDPSSSISPQRNEVLNSDHSSLHFNHSPQPISSEPHSNNKKFMAGLTELTRGHVDPNEIAKQKVQQQQQRLILQQQMEEKKRLQEEAKRKEMEYELKKEREMANFNPFGQPGNGAPSEPKSQPASQSNVQSNHMQPPSFNQYSEPINQPSSFSSSPSKSPNKAFMSGVSELRRGYIDPHQLEQQKNQQLQQRHILQQQMEEKKRRDEEQKRREKEYEEKIEQELSKRKDIESSPPRVKTQPDNFTVLTFEKPTKSGFNNFSSPVTEHSVLDLETHNDPNPQPVRVLPPSEPTHSRVESSGISPEDLRKEFATKQDLENYLKKVEELFERAQQSTRVPDTQHTSSLHPPSSNTSSVGRNERDERPIHKPSLGNNSTMEEEKVLESNQSESNQSESNQSDEESDLELPHDLSLVSKLEKNGVGVEQSIDTTSTFVFPESRPSTAIPSSSRPPLPLSNESERPESVNSTAQLRTQVERVDKSNIRKLKLLESVDLDRDDIPLSRLWDNYFNKGKEFAERPMTAETNVNMSMHVDTDFVFD